MTEIPETTEAATPSFLTEALREGGVIGADTAVAEIDHEPIGVGVGLEDLMRTIMGEAPTTICHGDFRVDNLLPDDHAEEGDRVAVIDWQISSRGPAITDVSYFLCQSMAVEERRPLVLRRARPGERAVPHEQGSGFGRTRGGIMTATRVDRCGSRHLGERVTLVSR